MLICYKPTHSMNERENKVMTKSSGLICRENFDYEKVEQFSRVCVL